MLQVESLQAEADFSREQLANMKQRQGSDAEIDTSDKENGVLGTSPPTQTIKKESQGRLESHLKQP